MRSLVKLILPFVGADNLQFGTTRSQIRRMIGLPTQVKKPWREPDLGPIDFYVSEGAMLHYDKLNCLEFIEFFAPTSPTLMDLQLMDIKYSELVSTLEAAGIEVHVEDAGFQSNSHGITLYFPSGQKTEELETPEAIGIFRKGYFD